MSLLQKGTDQIWHVALIVGIPMPDAYAICSTKIFFGWPKSNFCEPKIIWLAKNIKILYKNEGPKNFGQADGIGINDQSIVRPAHKA